MATYKNATTFVDLVVVHTCYCLGFSLEGTALSDEVVVFTVEGRNLSDDPARCWASCWRGEMRWCMVFTRGGERLVG